MGTEEFTLKIETKNAAFDEVDIGNEVAHMLRQIANRIDDGDYYPGHTQTIRDANGNRVGGYKFGSA